MRRRNLARAERREEAIWVEETVCTKALRCRQDTKKEL